MDLDYKLNAHFSINLTLVKYYSLFSSDVY